MARKAAPDLASRWLHAKLRSLRSVARPEDAAAITRAAEGCGSGQTDDQFDNPFTLDDLLVFDEPTLRDILASGNLGIEEWGRGVRGASPELVERVQHALPEADRAKLAAALELPAAGEQVVAARRHILDALFWELTYWKTPELYEELTAGEPIHPGIFSRLAPLLRGSTVLDAGAGSGRATFACLYQGAARIYALDSSPGLLRILDRKRAHHPFGGRITPLKGLFDAIPLSDNAVDIALSCSAFTSDPEQGGEPGLAEMRRVTRPGGYIVLIWPRPEDYGWLAKRGFRYVALPLRREMYVRFRSLQSALRVARRFYARNRVLARYLAQHRCPEVPYSLVGPNPPHDYCWLRTEN
jgi:ubiquinone/menaquinone biosynthesis C-methylase UbiE